MPSERLAGGGGTLPLDTMESLRNCKSKWKELFILNWELMQGVDGGGGSVRQWGRVEGSVRRRGWCGGLDFEIYGTLASLLFGCRGRMLGRCCVVISLAATLRSCVVL
jgi:hypothetical protein